MEQIHDRVAGHRGRRDRVPGMAGLAKGKLRPKIPQLTAALRGHFGAHHAIAAARILAHLDFLDDTISALDAGIAARVAGRYQSAARLLGDVPGLERRSVEVIIAETGADMSRPLTSHEVAVTLIAGTTTRTGLTVHAEHDTSSYPRGIKISDRQMRDLEQARITRVLDPASPRAGGARGGAAV